VEINDALLDVLVIAGQSGSGKSSLAREVCRQLNCSLASFGSFVRFEAKQRGIEPKIASLQSLGQDMITEFGPVIFTHKVLLSTDREQSGNNLVTLEGVRNGEIYSAVMTMSRRSLLVYLDVGRETRMARLRERESIDLHALLASMNHPLETGVPNLKALADLVLYDQAVDVLTARVIELLASRGLIDRG